MNQYNQCVEQGEILIMVGLHLCGTLSPRLVQIFSSFASSNDDGRNNDGDDNNKNENETKEEEIKHDDDNTTNTALLILSPCCMPKRDKSIAEYCRLSKKDPYRYWCEHVYNELNEGKESKRKTLQRKGMFVDENVLSKKNVLIWNVT
mmetsp:Transcript_39932/g.60372  ORF Transcript_39932/g.60372 Transcript_39932/m.60372 type:complete len:148 (+) Transcript_39932:2398-2841(+)